MNKLITLDSFKKINYKEIGFKCGIEIHQQLNTNKLFCSCPCIIEENNKLTKTIKRKLRFATSEIGTIDEAALDEFKKDKFNIYKYNNHSSCLTDLDEEPPKGPNLKALSVAIRISQMMNLTIFDEIQFMRKLIINGSITSGYQRTALLGINGNLKTEFGEVKINGINLEEDSCRTLEKKNKYTIFALDRQGIPLIEITTGTQINSSKEAYETAKQIGNILRSFPETKRGLGTIRQDLNVSIKGGSRIEIKGTQNLKLIPEIIDAEIKRQKIHLSIIEELKRKKINKNNFSDFEIYNISKIFEKTKSKIILENLKNNNSGVFAIKLKEFKGILGHELNLNYRFASEISNRNKQHFPTIKGLFHSDELPNYGITENEINKINENLNLKKEDGFILIANEIETTKKSLKYIFEIISQLITSIPEEVRMVDPKGNITKPLRPMPGNARMYPETDIPNFKITEKYLNKEIKKIPELYETKIKRLEKKYNLDKPKIENILTKYSIEKFEELIKTKLKTSQIYSILFELPKEIKKRENLDKKEIPIEILKEILINLEEKKINKDSLYKLFINLYKEKEEKINNINLQKYLKEKKLFSEKINLDEIENKIKIIIENNKGAPIGALMGVSMKEFQGKVEGKIISEILRKLI